MSRRVMPKLRSGKKPMSTNLLKGTKKLLVAALRAWELRNGYTPAPSVWEKRAK